MFLSKPEEQLTQELSCPICLQLYCDPVVLPCGHNYCRTCICKTAEPLDAEGKILPRCPECREEYQGVKTLQRNFKLCNIIEGYQATTAKLDGQKPGTDWDKMTTTKKFNSQKSETKWDKMATRTKLSNKKSGTEWDKMASTAKPNPQEPETEWDEKATAAKLDSQESGTKWDKKATALKLDNQPEGEQGKPLIFCDHCIDNKAEAVKTCLKCEVSLCSRHLQRHQEKESFRVHTMVEPLGEVGNRSCHIHSCPLEYFCSDDMSSLCAKCLLEGQHQDHDVLTFSIAEGEMRRVLETRNTVVSSRLQLTESLLKKAVEDQGASVAIGDKMVNKAVSTMDNMAGLVDRYRERLRALLEEERLEHNKTWQFGLSTLEKQQQLLLEATQSTTETLSETDTVAFINGFTKVEQKLREAVTATMATKVPLKPMLNTKRFQNDLKTQDFRSEMTHLLDSLHILLDPLELTFNICTAHPNLVMSTDLRTVRCSTNKQSYVEHPDRFTSAPQVMCSQSFSSGEHVWVAEVGASCMWSIGVCYKSIPRRGDHSRLGHNSVSWRLQWKNGKLTACTSSSNVALGEIPNQPVRIEMALDYEGGKLTFHRVKGHREHIYTFRAVFKEAVYPAFSIHSSTTESWITLHNGI